MRVDLDHLEALLDNETENLVADERQKAWERRVEENPAFTRAAND